MTDQTDTRIDRESRFEALRMLGWNSHFEQELRTMDAPIEGVARVLSSQRNQLVVTDGQDEQVCAPAGRFRNRKRGEYPVTGDWVLTKDGMATTVLGRKNILCRGEAGSRGRRTEAATREQPIAANIDTVFIVCGLDRDFNLRRMERYLALVYNCGISPVVVLTKADLHQSAETCRQEAEEVALGVPVILASMPQGLGADELRTYLGYGKTVAMIGSSGAGKSTLANMLHGNEIQATGAVSDSVGKGRHTTTARELIRMPGGGMLIDNPGIREIAFYAQGDGVETVFPDILELADMCRFADCSHMHEPGCAVRGAVENGELDPTRLESYHKMKREMDYASARSGKSADRVEKERWKGVAMKIKQINKNR